MPDHAGNGADWPAVPMRSAIPLRPAGDVQPIVVPAGRDQARRLIAAANELLALAAELEQGAAPAPAGDGYIPPTEFAPEDDGRWLRLARHTYRRRRSRILFFEESLFGEPAWDLLLDLFIAAKERKRVPVTSACIGAAVPTTTALRWLALLEDRGLVVREADPTDARRIFVRLTAEAYARMVAYFARAAAGESDEIVGAGR
jgi:hypothetical protein